MGASRSNDSLLTLAEAADYLADTERHVRQLWQERKLAGIKLGRKVRFRRSDIEAYVAANRVEALA